MSDEDAIRAVKNGDKHRYAELVERHQSMVYGIAWSRLGDRDLCDEAAQETFIKAYRYLEALRDPTRFPGWLARIARNVSTSLLRRRKAELDKLRRWELSRPLAEAGAADPADEKPLTETLRQVLSDMPLQHRECLVLFYLEGKSIEEAARALGISETAMKTRLHRARQALRGRLEAAVETSLSSLAPGKNLSAGVIPLLPAMPLAAGLAESTVVAKSLGLLAKSALGLSLFLWTTVVNGLFMSALFAWFGRLEAANLRPGPGKRFRTQVIRKNVLTLILGLLLVLGVVGAVGTYGHNPIMLFRLLIPFNIWGAYLAARTLRVNHTPYAGGILLACLTFLMVSVLVGFFQVSGNIFFVAMLPLNLVLYHTNKTRPGRHDYNLFLRHTQGLLGRPGEAPSGEAPFTRPGLRAFARFLGDRFLIVNYSFNREGIELTLAPVKAALEQQYGYTGSNSKVWIGFDARCRSRLSNKDHNDIRAFANGAPVDREDLECRVAEVVRSAYELFAAGEFLRVEALLQAAPDEDVLLKPVGESREHRIRGGIAIASAVLLLAMILFEANFADWVAPPPKEATPAEARAAILPWCREVSPYDSDFRQLLFSAHPPRELIGQELLPTFQAALKRFLKRDFRGADPDLIQSLHYCNESQVLSREELADLGFTPDKLRAFLQTAPEELDFFTRQKFYDLTDAYGRRYRYTHVEVFADAIACLEEFDCLDLLDSERTARDVAAYQLLPGRALPPGCSAVDTKDGNGLFHYCNNALKETHAALRILQALKRLDRIDRDACIEGIMRFYRGRGLFQSLRFEDGLQIFGNDEDAYHAMESLQILGALDRIEDLDRWRFKPRVYVVTTRGQRREDVVTADTIASWAFQMRLEQLRGH